MLLKANGIDVNQADKDGQTPLFGATWKGHKEIVYIDADKDGSTRRT